MKTTSFSSAPDSSVSGPGARPSRGRLRPKVMKFVRRLHMHTGLLLLPWLLFFGVSGVLFNHPRWLDGVEIEEQPLEAEQLQTLTELRPWNARDVAQDIVRRINEVQSTGYALDEDFASQIAGWPILMAPGDGVRYMLILDLDEAQGVLSRRPIPPRQEAPPFADVKVDLPQYTMASVERKVDGLLSGLGIEAPAELKAHPAMKPEIRFRMKDPNGTLWQVRYDVGNGQLGGRRADDRPKIGLNEMMSRMHKTHHYPINFGVKTLWALFADITGVTLVLWAVTGVVIWWQIKPSRVIGMMAVSIGLVVTLAVMSGLWGDLQFGGVTARSGPGGKGGAVQMKKVTSEAKTSSNSESSHR